MMSHTHCVPKCVGRTHTHTFCDPIITCLLQEKDLKVNQEASFMVQRNSARGVVDAKVHTPSGSSEECYVTELDSGMHHPQLLALSRLHNRDNSGFLISTRHL